MKVKFFFMEGHGVNRIIEEKLDRQIYRIEHKSEGQKARDKSEDN